MESKVLSAFYEGKSLDFIARMYSLEPKEVYNMLLKQGVILPDISTYDYNLVELNKLAGMIVQVGKSYSYCGPGRLGTELAEAYKKAGRMPMHKKIKVPKELSIEEHTTIIKLASEGLRPAIISKMSNRTIGEVHASIGGLYED